MHYTYMYEVFLARNRKKLWKHFGITQWLAFIRASANKFIYHLSIIYLSFIHLSQYDLVNIFVCNYQADMNAADSNGKTALHWAAAVDNYKAAEILLKCGANRDVQDLKEETPLFIAAKECSYNVAR